MRANLTHSDNVNRYDWQVQKIGCSYTYQSFDHRFSLMRKLDREIHFVLSLSLSPYRYFNFSTSFFLSFFLSVFLSFFVYIYIYIYIQTQTHTCTHIYSYTSQNSKIINFPCVRYVYKHFDMWQINHTIYMVD